MRNQIILLRFYKMKNKFDKLIYYPIEYIYTLQAYLYSESQNPFKTIIMKFLSPWSVNKHGLVKTLFTNLAFIPCFYTCILRKYLSPLSFKYKLLLLNKCSPIITLHLIFLHSSKRSLNEVGEVLKWSHLVLREALKDLNQVVW